MDIFLCILKSGVAWVILLFVGTNLIGFIVRGFLDPPSSKSFEDAPTERTAKLLSSEIQRMKRANAGMTVFAILLTAAYLFSLFHFWNMYLALAGGMLMLTRLPDLLWEVRNGAKVTPQSQPSGPLFIAGTLFMCASLPLTWYALCWY